MHNGKFIPRTHKFHLIICIISGLEPPTLLGANETDIDKHQGSDLLLTCPATGTGPFTYKWTRPPVRTNGVVFLANTITVYVNHTSTLYPPVRTNSVVFPANTIIVFLNDPSTFHPPARTNNTNFLSIPSL